MQWGLDTRPPNWPVKRDETDVDEEPTYLISEKSFRNRCSFLEHSTAGSLTHVDGFGRIEVHGLDEFALLVMLHDKSPRRMSTMMMGKIQVAASYLGGSRVLTTLYHRTFKKTSSKRLLGHPQCITRPLVVLLKASLENEDVILFKDCVAAAIQYADGLLPQLGLVFPQALIGK